MNLDKKSIPSIEAIRKAMLRDLEGIFIGQSGRANAWAGVNPRQCAASIELLRAIQEDAKRTEERILRCALAEGINLRNYGV